MVEALHLRTTNDNHAKHHNTYDTNYNVAMEKYLDAQVKGDVAAMVALVIHIGT